MEYKSSSVEQTEDIACEFSKTLKGGECVAFLGDLGAGKTAFVRGMAKGLNVYGEVCSPTFALVHEYTGEIPLIHFDMYRITGEDDLYTTGFYDYLDGHNILAVEWSENITDYLPSDSIVITINRISDNERTIKIN